MEVLLIGAGRYGNGLVGRKYAKGELKAKLAGVVDPKIDEIKKSPSYFLQGIPAYHSIEEVPATCIKDCVSEIALVPQIVPDTVKKLASEGAKKFILPKPVAISSEDFNSILNITEDKSIDAVVASNWHYSGITKMTKALINKLTDKPIDDKDKLPQNFADKLNELSGGYKIDRVEVEYNKKFETLAIDPPLQELPHALQIVYSTGCTDLKGNTLVMNKALQSKSRVNIGLTGIKSIKEGINLNSDLQMQEKLDKKRERLLKVYLEKNGEKVTVTTDYDADFTPNGICIKRPSIQYEAVGAPEYNWKYEINEDNMNVMYGQIFDYMRGERNGALTVEDYSPISSLLCQAEQLWKIQK